MSATQSADDRVVRALTRRYVVVYALGTFGDWIQGAYLYAAYRRHGLAKRDIGGVYVLGYVVSATIGTSIASVGDAVGHRGLVVAYGTLYAASCVLLRSSSWSAILMSRVLGGVAYSLLFSSFESWVITEADEAKIERRRLASLFSVATFFNAASAVAAGLVGNFVVELTESPHFSWVGMDESRSKMTVESDLGGSELILSRNVYAPAFDVGAVSLLLCAVGAKYLWTNRVPTVTPEADEDGDIPEASPKPKGTRGTMGKIVRAVRMILVSNELFRLGAANSLYEAALHLFVFVWTPVLEKRSGEGVTVPYGMIFSGFMVCKMFGSQAFHLLESRVQSERLLRLVLVGSAISFGVTVTISSYWLTLAAFSAFEFGLGIYWPVMSVLRAKYVPNKMRATMTSAFRIPLNVLVVVLLIIAGRASDKALLALCAMMMVASYVLFGWDRLVTPTLAAEKATSVV